MNQIYILNGRSSVTAMPEGLSHLTDCCDLTTPSYTYIIMSNTTFKNTVKTAGDSLVKRKEIIEYFKNRKPRKIAFFTLSLDKRVYLTI